MEVPSLQQFNELNEEVKRLRQNLDEALRLINGQQLKPAQWYPLKDARKFFGAAGVERHSFKRWVMEWIDNGTLQPHQYKTMGDTILISVDFLASAPGAHPSRTLKKAS
jgi:hypothetical protein